MEAPVALVTGASRGLGLALARALAARDWALVIDARGSEALGRAGRELATATQVHALVGDVGDEDHRAALAGAVASFGRLDLLVNNASLLGPSPQPVLAEYPLEVLRQVYEVNLFAPLRLTQMMLPLLRASGGRVINVTSDAAGEAYEGWGGYGSSKAALDQMSNVLGAEETGIKVYWVDPGDMRTQMHQEAFPGEDISDRPPPEDSVGGLLELIEGDLISGRYKTADLGAAAGARG